MKHLLFKTVLLLSMVATSFSCTEDSTNTTVDPNTDASAQFTLGEVGTYQVEVEVVSSLVSQCAYQVTTDMSATAPAPAVLFAEGTVETISDSPATITVSSLEGDTEYKIFICAKYDEALGYSDVVELGSFTTAGYSEFVTIMPSDDLFSIKMYIEVPEGKTIAYCAIDLDDYKTWMEYGVFYDAYFLTAEKGKLDVVTESQIVTYDGDGTFAPGQAVQVIVGEVVDGELDYYNRETWEPLFDVDSYAADLASIGSIDPDDYWTTDYHFSQTTNVTGPTVLDDHIGYEIVSSTTQSVTFSLTMPDAIDQYVYSVYGTSDWNYLVSVLGEDGAIFFATAYYDGYATEDMLVTATDLEAGLTYQLILIGRGTNSNGAEITLDIVEFAPAEATLPAPTVKVSAIDVPEGYEESAFEVWFNIKSDSKDVSYIKYLCNDTRSWLLEINEGSSYTSLMDANGNLINTAEVIDSINSDEGYNMAFSSTADTETGLLVVAGNIEETESSAEAADAYATNWTIPIPDADTVYSDLFTALLGDWTATAYVMTSDDSGYTYYRSTTPITGDVTISTAPAYPETLSDEVYAAYPSKTTAEVDELFEQFKESSAKFEASVRGQNRLLCEGSVEGNFDTGYSSPFDLFYDEYYTIAVTTDDLFNDFGPKWFLEIHDDGSVTIPIDPLYIPPFNGYSSTFPLYQYAVEPYEYVVSDEITEFSVTVSDDRNTITLNDKYYDGVQYCYSAGYDYYGFFIQSFMCYKMTLTRNEVAASIPQLYPLTELKGVDKVYVTAKSMEQITSKLESMLNR